MTAAKIRDLRTATNAPAIRLINYMSDREELEQLHLIGPYPDVDARHRDMRRLEALPLGAPEFNGGYEFEYAGMCLATAHTRDWPEPVVVDPGQVAAATTIEEFFAAFFGYDLDPDEDTEQVHPDQLALTLEG